MSKFQIILTAIFVVFIGVGVTMFATYKGTDTSQTSPTVTIWGSYPEATFNEFVQRLSYIKTDPLNIKYTEFSKSDFRKQFIEELASGRGPDAILIPQQDIMGFFDKIIEIPNTTLSQRDFQNSFIGQANLYLTENGALAIPLTVDPLVMYWNRSMFTNAGIAKYPVYWDEFSNINKKITQKDVNSNIRRSAVALGEFQNIDHAREILSALLFQAGNPITFYSNGVLQSRIGDDGTGGARISSPALGFYTKFSDPRSSEYSWNRSLLSSKNSFLSGTLATYFGFTSEISDLRAKNPNLDFDVSPLPQARNGKTRVTYGNMYGLSIVRSSKDVGSTYSAIQALTAPDAMDILSKLVYLPSIRRDIIAGGSVDPYMAIFLDAALISKGWLDTSSIRSNQIFTEMVESVTSGRSDLYGALRQADDELNISLKSQ